MNDYLKLFQSHAEYEAFVSGGTMVKPNVSHCVDENEVHYNPHTFADEYFTTVALDEGTIDFTIFPRANTSYITSFAYSKNDGEWVETQNSDNRQENIVISVSVVEGDKVRWKGIASHIGNDIYNGGAFTSTCRFDAQGNIMSLLYGDDFKDKVTLEEDYSFSYLFNDMDNGGISLIVNASNLIIPAITLTSGCYINMFYGCTNLTTAPELPATTLASNCYNGMFTDCASLTVAPELPATTLAESCYSYMFYDCASLTTAPSVLPATTLIGNCYDSMFRGCTNLTVAPELPATTLAHGCYSNMFYGCASLITVPTLLATTLVHSCYFNMFRNCTSLNSITCLATNISATNCTNNWVNGVAASGTFRKAASMNSWGYGANGIPTNWTVQDAS